MNWALLLFQLFFVLANASQTVLRGPTIGIPRVLAAYDEGLFTPMEDMNLLSETDFSVLSHPAFPNYNVRIKKSAFCDDTVKAYTGYIDIEARHIFFYFFESRNDPDTDDVIFWTNGGAHTQAEFRAFHVNSPMKVLAAALAWACSWNSGLAVYLCIMPFWGKDANGTKFHPESWNTNANIFFVDQPIGVGFSYADYGESVATTEEGAKDMAAFIFVFFEHFTKFKGRSFHITGESYGGRYVPVFAAEVYDQNAKLSAAGYTPINLTSIMIGNGITDFYHQMSSSFDMQCTSASVPPTLSIAECVRMKPMVPRCEKRLKESCVDVFDAIDCAAAATFCDTHLKAPFWSSGEWGALYQNSISNGHARAEPPMIFRSPATRLAEAKICVILHIRAYLSRPDVREMLGVDEPVPANFSSCAPVVGSAFRAQMDSYRLTQDYVGGLLERGVRVLIYVGTYDWICNWVGNERWTLALEWSGQAEFSKEPLRPWAVGGDFAKGRAGLARSAKGLTFATIDKAGHMVPYDKPKEALELVQRIIASISQPLVTNASGQINCLRHATSTFEDIISCFDAFTVSEGFYTDETYAAAQPNNEELSAWEDLITSLLSVDGNCTSVIVPASIADIYDVSLFTDPAGPQYCIASETNSVDGLYAKGWGLVAVPAAQKQIMRDIHLAAPHPAFDLFTPEQAGALFKSTGARSLLIAGRSRTANLAPSDCVIPASNTTTYYKTDPAHDTAEPFFSASKTIRNWQHANGGCPAQSYTMFLSTGIGRSQASVAWYTDTVDRPIKRLKTELMKAFPTWNVSLPSDSACSLTATDNVFGRLVNGIPEQLVCTNASTADLTTGEFIHAEQAIISRGSSAYSGWTAALLAAFTPANV
ncbi:Carboxypeptidase [Mycena venus]|uniref:Carboxypeptidase n=1 Tax=Mycena venus TaxID=2733690 RepID=A0A8H6XH86_9AGAR|nr:Carboxypeptidase [Mycena venus]